MKAILLAAGRGTRISRNIGQKPKCTLDIGGTSLIRNSVKLLIKNKINVSVVVGYKKEAVINSLKGLKIKYFYNPFYDVTNSIASLWFARKELSKDDIIIMNADVYFEEDILKILLREKRNQVMLMDSGRKNDYLFRCKGSKLVDQGKEIKKATGEYVGMAKIRKSFLNKFNKRLNLLIENQQHNLWWENVLYSFIKECNVNIEDIRGIFWSEIDFIEDYYKIIDHRQSINETQK